MLVALQRTGADRPLPPAAEHLVGLLRSWGPGPDHLPGLALAGITLPSRLGPRSVDALVFTRCGVVVIAAHEPGPAQWPGPGDRTGEAVAAAKGALAGHEGGRHVTGLVAVVPQAAQSQAMVSSEQDSRPGRPEMAPQASEPGLPGRGGEGGPVAQASEPGLPRREGEGGPVPQTPEPRSPRPEREGDPSTHPAAEDPGHDRAPEPAAAWPDRQAGVLPAPPSPPRTGRPALHWPEPEPVPGVAVVLADSRGLRRIIAQHNRWRTVWSADDVLDACYALSLAHLAPPRAALIADGFPARLPVLDRLPELPTVIPVLPAPPPAPVAEDDPVPWTPSARGAVVPRQRPIRQIPWILLFVLTVLVTVGVVAAVFVAQVFHGS